MKVDLITKRLYTDGGELIKQLHCPYRVAWKDMKPAMENARARSCAQCEHVVLDTALYTETELVKQLEQDPNTCLKINMEQKNIRIIHHAEGI